MEPSLTSWVTEFDIDTCCSIQKISTLKSLIKKQIGSKPFAYKCTDKRKIVGYGHNMNRGGSSSQDAFKLIGADWQAVFDGKESLTEDQCEQLFSIDTMMHYTELK